MNSFSKIVFQLLLFLVGTIFSFVAGVLNRTETEEVTSLNDDMERIHDHAESEIALAVDLDIL